VAPEPAMTLQLGAWYDLEVSVGWTAEGAVAEASPPSAPAVSSPIAAASNHRASSGREDDLGAPPVVMGVVDVDAAARLYSPGLRPTERQAAAAAAGEGGVPGARNFYVLC
jgi:hypothetical protein